MMIRAGIVERNWICIWHHVTTWSGSGAADIFPKKSALKHEKAEIGVFVGSSVEDKEVLSYNYTTPLVY